nr:hypothetical protein [Candidatus Accumulibacter sp. ACC012]
MAGPVERRRLLAEQTGDRGDKEDISRGSLRAGNRNSRATLDQAGIEIGVGESRADHQAMTGK